MAAVVVAGAAPSLSAQQRREVRGGRPPLLAAGSDRTTHNTASVLIEPSASIANLFVRAEEGIARADWKFAIDCLQRIIDDPEGSLVPRSDSAIEDGFLYESARRQAMRRLASLPPEGLHAYRLLYDGKAKRLYERAEAAHDPRQLRVVVDRYLLSRYGDDATDLLASWALDAGRAGETVTLLIDLLELVPDRDVPEPLIVAKLAAAYALLGRTEEAASVVEAYAKVGDGGKPSGELTVADAVLRLRPYESEHTDDLSSWRMVGGSEARRGRMPAVKPTLVQPVPWRFDLPGAGEDAWRRMFVNDRTGPLVLPVGQLVADDRTVFVRTPRGCVALDVEDLTVRWESQEEAYIDVPAVQATGRRTPSRSPTAGSSDVDLVFEDHVAGAISLGYGLVMTVSRNEERTRLVAYDAGTGRIRWQRGATDDPDDPLGAVEFRSVPIAVGDALWVPFMRQGDFNVGLLDPEDGSLIRSVLLCSVSQSRNERAPAVKERSQNALQPASAYGVVYVLSGHGVLFAVDARRHTIRWASRYGPALPLVRDSNLAPARRGQRAATVRERSTDGLETPPHTGWLCSPPVVTGGLVLVAPTLVRDSNLAPAPLLALSAATGEPRWSAQCRNCSYIIAADSNHVWLGGRSISCLSLADGEPVWTADITSTTAGRAVLSNGLVHVPTLGGLLSLDAASGETVTEASLPGSQSPLGNLLCLGSAMFTINPSCVRKFPDLGQSYPVTMAAHEANPSDVVLSIRLAWLELWRGEPQRAYEVLEQSGSGLQTSGLSEEPSARSLNLAQVSVETLLALAKQSAKTRDAGLNVLALLEQAAGTARTASDRLRCELAVADELSALGRAAEAYRRLWQLGISPVAEQVVSFGEHVEGMARFDIARRLRQLTGDLSEEHRRQLGEYTRDQVDLAVQCLGAMAKRSAAMQKALPLSMPAPSAWACHPREALSRLRAIGDLQTPGPVGRRALLELASYHARRLHYEQAEQLMQEATGYGLQAAARSLKPEALSVQLTSETAWTIGWEQHSGVPRIVSFGEQSRHTSVLAERLVLFSAANVVYGYDANDGTLLWKATLRLPETFTDEVVAATTAARAPRGGRQIRSFPRRAVADGQTAVFNGGTALFAVGLVTGRRIWVEPSELILPASTTRRGSDQLKTIPNFDMTMAASDGLLAATPGAGRLTLMRMLDGSTVWERDMRGERVGRIWMAEGRVITTDPLLERVHVFDRTDGSLVNRAYFNQPDPGGELINLVRTGRLLCGPISTTGFDAVSAVDVDSGEVAWRTSMDKPIIQLFKPKEGYVGIGLLGGEIRIVDAATGDLVLARRVSGAHTVIAGALVNGTLLVQHLTLRDANRYSELTAMDVATGEELWRRDDLVTFSRLDEPLRVIGGRVPAVVREVVGASRGGRRAQVDTRFAMIDVRTGNTAGAKVKLPPASRPTRFNGDFEVVPSAAIAVVGTADAIYALRTESMSASVGEATDPPDPEGSADEGE